MGGVAVVFRRLGSAGVAVVEVEVVRFVAWVALKGVAVGGVALVFGQLCIVGFSIASLWSGSSGSSCVSPWAVSYADVTGGRCSPGVVFSKVSEG